MHLKKKNYLLMKNTALILYHILMRLCGLLAYKQLNFVFFYSNIGIFFYIENDGEQNTCFKNTQFQYTPEI